MVTVSSLFAKTIIPSIHGSVDAQELVCLGIDPVSVIDFSANQSPLGPAPGVIEAIVATQVECYPDRNAFPLVEAIARYHAVDPDCVVAGNGSTELIRLIAQLALRDGDTALMLLPTFGEYEVATALAGGKMVAHTLDAATGFAVDVDALLATIRAVQPRLCWLCSPNNPTGTTISHEALDYLLSHAPETLFVLDEAYCDLLPEPQWTMKMLSRGNLIAMRSMTKAWGLAGLRLGYAIGDTALMHHLSAAKPPWNVNACAQAAGIAALAQTAHYMQTKTLLQQEKTRLVGELTAMGWQVLPATAAFFLVHVGDAEAMKRKLLAHRCLVRDCTSFGLPEYIRISPRHPEQNTVLLQAMREVQP